MHKYSVYSVHTVYEKEFRKPRLSKCCELTFKKFLDTTHSTTHNRKTIRGNNLGNFFMYLIEKYL